MSTLATVAVVVAGLLLLLALGGALANSRRRRATQESFELSLDEVNRALAAAHAGDKGWEPAGLDAAAQRAFSEAHPGTDVRSHALVAVIDEPGAENDKAVFRFVTDSGESRLTLGRTAGGDWVTESVE